jgi:hypothetical protein
MVTEQINANVNAQIGAVVAAMPEDAKIEFDQTGEFDALVKIARDFGTRYGAPYLKAEATFKKEFTDRVDDFIRLRTMFPGERSRDTRNVDGVEYTWGSFCQTFLYITPNYFARLTRELRPGPPKPKPDPAPPEDHPKYREGYRAGQEAALAAEEDEDKEPLEVAEDGSFEVADAPDQSDLAATDVIAYFASYKSDAEQFAEALRALVRHFGLARKISVELI